MALDEATAAFVAQAAAAGGTPFYELPPVEARALGAALLPYFGTGPDVAKVEDVVATAGSVGVPIRLVVPYGSPRAVIVYYHGGGWVTGSVDEVDALGRAIADQTQATVALVDYRLAPENPFPAAADDAWTALEWVAEHRASLADADAPLIVMGDSAGGNLAAVVARKARDAGAPDLALQVLIYPVIEPNFDNGSYLDPDNQLILNRDAMIWFWNNYAPDIGTRQNPDLSPSQAGDLAGLPPAVVITAEHDVLRDEGETYAAALRTGGVSVVQRRFSGQMHGFFTLVNMLPGAVDGLDFVAGSVNRHLSRPTD